MCLLGVSAWERKGWNRPRPEENSLPASSRSWASWEMPGASTAWCSAGGAPLYHATLCQQTQAGVLGRLHCSEALACIWERLWRSWLPEAGYKSFLEENSVAEPHQLFNFSTVTMKWCFRMVVFNSTSPRSGILAQPPNTDSDCCYSHPCLAAEWQLSYGCSTCLSLPAGSCSISMCI